jgi:hypothetical protein
MAKKLEVIITGDARSLRRALSDSERGVHSFGGRLGSLAKSAGLAAGAGGLVLLTKGLVDSVKAASDAQQSTALLDRAFKNAHVNIGAYGKQLDLAEAKGRKLGFTDTQQRASLGALITATGSAKQSFHLLTTAYDLARYKGVDLTTATRALTMAHAGSKRALTQLGIKIQPVTTWEDKLAAATKDHTTVAYKNAKAIAKQKDNQLTFRKIVEAVTQKVHGQARAFSKTGAGAVQVFRAQLDHLEVSLGKKILPYLVKAVNWVNQHWPEITKTVGGVLKTVGQDIKKVSGVIQAFVSHVGGWKTVIEGLVAAFALAKLLQIAAAFGKIATGVRMAAAYGGAGGYGGGGYMPLPGGRGGRGGRGGGGGFTLPLWASGPAIAAAGTGMAIQYSRAPHRNMLQSIIHYVSGDWINQVLSSSKKVVTAQQMQQMATQKTTQTQKKYIGTMLHTTPAEAAATSATWKHRQAVQAAGGAAGKAGGMFKRNSASLRNMAATTDAATGKTHALTSAVRSIPSKKDVNLNVHTHGKATLDSVLSEITGAVSKNITFTVTTLRRAAKVIGGKQGGGSVRGGAPYMVGEMGPELFVPGSSGSIVSNRRLRGGGGRGDIHVYIDGVKQNIRKTQLRNERRGLLYGAG